MGALVAQVVALTLLVLLALPGPQQQAQAQSVRLGVLLNVTEQLDPLVSMNLTQIPANQSGAYIKCSATQPPNATVVPRNGNWTATCDENNFNMTSLNISAMTAGAVPTIPTSISNMFALRNLTMSGIGLQGPLSETLGWMGFLLNMDISHNNLNGTIPATFCTLTNITSLKLNNNQLSGTIDPAISQLTALFHLDLGHNLLQGSILQSLNTLTRLTYLNISGYDPRASNTTQPGIRSVLASTMATPSFVADISVVGSSLQNLTGLRALDLSNNPNITGNLSNLPWLSWAQLQTLNISGTNVVGPFPKDMLNLTNLTSLGGVTPALCGDPNSVELADNTTFACTQCPGVCYPPSTRFELPVGVIVAIVISCAVVVMGALIAAYFILRARRFNDGVEVHGVRRFTLPELQEATDNYSIQLGKGGFGEVYKGIVDAEEEGEKPKEVAVKRTKAERRRNMKKFDSGFRNEILVLSGVRHRNLVELIGYSSKGADVLLVYEFIAQGSVDDLLKKEMTEEDGEGEYNLTWERRLKIAFGAAQGLDYLHSGVTPPIIHRDIKSSNILVDAEFVAKVADFGLSKIRPEMELDGQKTLGVQGTLGYIDPEYAATLKPTERSDVYSFGVVLLELATGWRPIGGPEKKHIIQRVAKSVNNSGFDSIVALSIRKEVEGEGFDGEGGKPTTTAVLYSGNSSSNEAGGAEVTIAAYSPELFQRFVKLGMQCCAKDSSTRPSMRIVAKSLGEMIEGKAEDPADAIYEERFDEEGGEEVVLLTHNLGGEVGATVAFIMDTQAGPR